MLPNEIYFSVLPGKNGQVGEILLNRPNALNALTHDMCQALGLQLMNWQLDPNIKAVIIRGEGERAFCAGGDIRAVYQNRQDKAGIMRFFQQEYSMNKIIFHFPKPYISLLDGITMGGGAGVSMHGSHRVASEFFSFAMPETAIGLYPDIGAGYFLNRCPGKMGYYLGLTGVTLKASDALMLGLVNHYVAREHKEILVESICQTPLGHDPFRSVSEIIQRHHSTLPPSELIQHQQVIDKCFSANTMQTIMQRLSDEHSFWSQEIFKILQKRSPMSLVVTLRYLKECDGLSFDQIMAINLTLTNAFIRDHDFFEGVRAVLIDKDQAPQWRPSSLEECTDDKVGEYFKNS